MWIKSSCLPEIDSEGSSADVLGCFTDGRMLVVFYDATAKCWMNADDGSVLDGVRVSTTVKFWRHLPGLPADIILPAGL